MESARTVETPTTETSPTFRRAVVNPLAQRVPNGSPRHEDGHRHEFHVTVVHGLHHAHLGFQLPHGEPMHLQGYPESGHALLAPLQLLRARVLFGDLEDTMPRMSRGESCGVHDRRATSVEVCAGASAMASTSQSSYFSVAMLYVCTTSCTVSTHVVHAQRLRVLPVPHCIETLFAEQAVQV